MKNSVITWAIIGSLVCLLLVVIAISCSIRLFNLRNSGNYRSSLTNAAIFPPGPFANCELPFPITTGDLDATLFRLDHSVFLREPPPSYASTMGGYADVGDFNNSYMEQYRRYRRQRRCRRMLRRQQRQQNGQQMPGAGEAQLPGDPNTVGLGLATGETAMTPIALSLPTVSLIPSDSPPSFDQATLQLDDTTKKPEMKLGPGQSRQ